MTTTEPREGSQSSVDWKAEVIAYGNKGLTQSSDVFAAQDQITSMGTLFASDSADDYWEAVYTLAHQRAQMRGAAE
jgi:hypothetical protein